MDGEDDDDDDDGDGDALELQMPDGQIITVVPNPDGDGYMAEDGECALPASTMHCTHIEGIPVCDILTVLYFFHIAILAGFTLCTLHPDAPLPSLTPPITSRHERVRGL